jgi:predicted nucleic acid-binding protein
MPLVYADTSALFAFFHPKDQFSTSLTDAVREFSPDFVYWSYIRFELRHNLRQSRFDTYGEVAWRALWAAERTQARLRWEPNLKCDSVIEAADEFSGHRARQFAAGSGDFLHILAARRLLHLSGIDGFWTCDTEQAKAAKGAGLDVRLFTC